MHGEHLKNVDQRHTVVPGRRPLRMGGSSAGTAAPAIPTAITGISLIVHWGGGLYWLAPAALLGIAAAVYSGWVLLVEIVR
jgi:hypothetical protein